MKEKITIIVLILTIVLIGWKGCQISQEKKNLIDQITSYKEGEKIFKSKILSDSSTMSQQSQTILSQSDAIKLGLLKLEGDIAKVQSQVRQKQTISIDDIAVPFIPNNYADTSGWMSKINKGDSSKALIDSLLANSIIIPKKFSLNQKWYSINGQVKKEGILIDSLKIENESSVTVGWKNSGFLGMKKEPIVEIKNTNPFLTVTKMDNVVIKKKKGIFESKLFWGGLGILGGLILSK